MGLKRVDISKIARSARRPQSIQTVNAVQPLRTSGRRTLSRVLLSERVDIPIGIILHAIYVGDDFESGSRGKTGEFYWHSVISDGDDVVLADSKDFGLGNDGVIHKIEHEWLPVDKIPLYTGKVGPIAGSATVGFRLVESDDSSEAKSIFAGLGTLGKAVVTAYTGNPEAGLITDGVVELAMKFLDLDEDDVALTGARGLTSLDNYRIGRFMKFEGSLGYPRCAAIMSVVPVNDHGEEDFSYKEESNLIGTQTREITVSKEGQLAFFVRRPWVHYLPKATITIRRKGGGFEKKFGFKFWLRKNLKVQPGTYEITLSGSLLPLHLQTIVTAFGPTLAANTYYG